MANDYAIGMVGLGVMGRNLMLNMADHGFSVAGYDNNTAQVATLQQESGERKISCTSDIGAFVNLLRSPRTIMVLVPAGAPVDSVIKDLIPHLQAGDLIIDGGNSYFKDTDVRGRDLAGQGIQFMGMGVSGGEEGARRGPSLMPGGPKESYARVQAIFEAAAAKVNGEPCVSWLGPASTGHFVKMVHNGIEYGLMQLIAEAYDLMKRGLGLTNDELQGIFSIWNQGELNGYLMEITAEIFAKKDDKTDKRLIDEILDVARQKGTGMWTSQSAMELQVPIPTIDVAVAMRDLSVFEGERKQVSQIYKVGSGPFKGDRKVFLSQLELALYVAIALTYAQGFALLAAASRAYKYQIDLEAVAKVWRGGCIIRSALLEDICAAFRANPALENLLLDPGLSSKILARQASLRQIVSQAAELGVPIPGLMVSLGYFDAYRSAWLPANLIQAQRDFFGAHTYERLDKPRGEFFHTNWTGRGGKVASGTYNA